MNSALLKKIRIGVSALFFILFTFAYLDLSGFAVQKLSVYVTYLQFIPSILKLLSIISIAATGFIIVTVLTFLFGRVYCSSICPMGTLQDIISFFARKLNNKKYFRLNKEYKFLKYSLLAVTVISFFSGSLIIIDLLDPYSNTGKIFSNLFRPVLILVNNFIAFTFGKANIYFLYPIETNGFSIAAIGFSLIILGTIGIMSYMKGRLFCNTICPVGTLLGLFSRYSMFKISIDKGACISCNLCERVCKAGCIDKKNKLIYFERCVSCFNCFEVCPKGGISYTTSIKQTGNDTPVKIDNKKREFISKTFLYAFGLTTISFGQIKIIPKKLSKIQNLKKNTVSPPGSKSISHFAGKCTACHLCVSACPAQVLQPSLWEYGFTGILQPFMDYKVSYCNHDCLICGQVCPTGAILPLTIEQKKFIQIGKVNFIKDNCIVETEGTECGACSEHCPTKAVQMVPYKNQHLPEIHTEYCVGCGACEFACPVKPYKAIYVDGNPVHQTAKEKIEEKIKQKVDLKSDFPF
ncbi:MAG: 4Fe-4S dicluster domain-containing protein [Ignavibacteriaceae bacterium]|nr:4Fe-4S dicluster domain-containing protein [Ignavibacteriaceae bacterium]